MAEILRLDERGRIVIPKKIRKQLGIDVGSRVKIYVEKSKIIIEPLFRIKKVKAKVLDEAFFDAGKATFGE